MIAYICVADVAKMYNKKIIYRNVKIFKQLCNCNKFGCYDVLNVSKTLYEAYNR